MTAHAVVRGGIINLRPGVQGFSPIDGDLQSRFRPFQRPGVFPFPEKRLGELQGRFFICAVQLIQARQGGNGSIDVTVVQGGTGQQFVGAASGGCTLNDSLQYTICQG